MDFLTNISLRYSDEARDDVDEEDPSDSGESDDNHNDICENNILGDNLVSMLLKPSFTTQESEVVIKFYFIFILNNFTNR